MSQIFTDYGGGNLYVATHGRGMWKLPLTTGSVYITRYESGLGQVWVDLKASDGSVVWKVSPFSGNMTPTYSNGALYFVLASGGNLIGAYAYDAATEVQRWQHPLSGAYSNGVTMAHTAVANGAVYFAANQTVYALNASTGALIWSYQLGAQLGGESPAVDANAVYMGASDGKEYAFSVSTGAQLWSRSINSTKGPAPSPSTAANGLVYVASNDSTTTSKDTLYALNASTGRVSYSRSLGVDTLVNAPLVGNGLVYYTASSGWLYAVTPDLSTYKWSFRQGQSGAQGGPFLDGNRLFLIEDSHVSGANMTAVDTTTGTMLWSTSVSESLQSQGYIPTAAEGVVYATGTYSLYAFAEVTGRVLWQGSSPLGFIGVPVSA